MTFRIRQRFYFSPKSFFSGEVYDAPQVKELSKNKGCTSLVACVFAWY